jgi:hypothetical protein
MVVTLPALRAGRALPPKLYLLVLIYVTGLVNRRATVRLERLRKLKNAMTSSGLEPVTFGLVA